MTALPEGPQPAKRRNCKLLPLAPPDAIAVPERVVTMAGAGWPDRVDALVVQRLLDVVHELGLRLGELQRLQLGRPAQNGGPVRRSDRCANVPKEAIGDPPKLGRLVAHRS